uniref:Reverse gyrase n=2 Tax=Staphylothermus marinus TaxID=2280 RepID=A0A7C4D8I2_STAMA
MLDIRYEHGVYQHSCPNCGGENTDYRLIFKAPCPNCLRDDLFEKIKNEIVNKDYLEKITKYYELVNEKKGLSEIVSFHSRIKSFEEFFAKATNGYRLWSAQRTWITRLFKNRSFSIVAPTGTGKTMFALVTSLYFTKEDKSSKVYLVFPTTPLLIQAYKRLLELANRAGIKICSEEENYSDDCIRVIAIHGRLNKNKRDEYIKLINEDRFNILLSTNMFMHRNFELLLNKNFKLIVLDDVDAILRSSRAIRVLFRILGLTDEEIDNVIEYLKVLNKLATKMNENERTEVENKLKELNNRLNEIRSKVKTLVVVSSATGRPRGIYPKLFKIILGFEVGSRSESIRNIVDTYVIPLKTIEETVVDLVKKLGDGGLVFVPLDKGIEYADKIASILNEHGLKTEAFYSGKSINILDKFANGDINVLVGVATYYGVMVRGIDLPDRVKYAIFIGVPRHKFSSKLEKIKPVDLLRILTTMRDVLEGEERRELEIIIGKLSNKIKRISPSALAKLTEDLNKKIAGESVEETPLLKLILNAIDKAKQLLSKPDVWSKLSVKSDIALIRENGTDYILIPDVATYIQASGRTSRLYPGGVTKGLSIIIVDDIRLLNGLKKRMKWLYEEFDIKPLNEINLDDLINEINSDRDRVRKILRGEIEVDKIVELTKTALLIVESPNKAKTIANFFGKPSARLIGDNILVYDVAIGKYVLSIVSSIGHIYELVVDYKNKDNEYGILYLPDKQIFVPVYTDIKKCNRCGHQFTDEVERCPKCGNVNISRKRDIVNVLRDLASEVDVVFIGTDPDTEGEKIGWDLKVLLEPYSREIKRVEFHEITRKAILEAINNPREIDPRLVEAQIVRRVEDRWLGFALSSIVQKYFWSKYCLKLHENLLKLMKKGKKIVKTENSEGNRVKNGLFDCCIEFRNLSAGRVQTPVLGFIIDKFREQLNPINWKYRAVVNIEESINLEIDIDKELYDYIRENLSRKTIFADIRILDVREEIINPPPPFTTDTLLEEASIKLGLSTSKTMEIAQDLFELGLITYHRTDSIRVSDTGIAIARSYLEERFGEKVDEYFKPRTWSTGGAHEAIRPTKPIDPDRLRELVKEGVLILAKPLTNAHYELYRLIFERFIASQMSPARVVKQYIEVSIENYRRTVERVIDVKYHGFLEIYSGYVSIEREIESGKYPVKDIRSMKPPIARFHDVIKWMKINGIGRPSTYAKIVQTLINRKYVAITGKQKALRPTSRGIFIYKELVDHFKDVVDVEVTRRLEEKMKEVEDGKRDYQNVLKELYDELKTKIIENKNVLDKLEKEWSLICRGGIH